MTLADLFEDGGALHQAKAAEGKTYEYRKGQVTMSTGVDAAQRDEATLAVEAGTGIGKALDVDTPIATPDGWTRMGDLCRGDRVFDDRGSPCTVTHAFAVQYDRPCYEVRFSDGAAIVADADHLWGTTTRQTRRRASRAGTPTPHADRDVVTTTQIAATLRTPSGHVNHAIPIAAALALPECDLPVDPYVLGVWLADGTRGTAQITTGDPEVMAEVAAAGYPVRSVPSHAYGYHVSDPAGATTHRWAPSLTRTLRTLGVLHDKRIPPAYLRAGTAQRAALLQGLMDSDGWVDAACVSYASSSPHLAADVAELVASLGYRAAQYTRQGIAHIDRARRQASLSHTLSFTTRDAVFRLTRKHDVQQQRLTHHTGTRTGLRYITDVVPVASRPVRCITVDSPSHLFLAGRSLVPTHNSLAYSIAAARARRRVIVSTGTKLLQDQLLGDQDVISATVGRPVKLATLKGRSNYVCNRRLAELESVGGEAGAALERLREWAAFSDIGEIEEAGELPPGLREQVTTDRHGCTGKACDWYDVCFTERAKARARTADIVLTNHSLLVFDGLVRTATRGFAGVLPPTRGVRPPGDAPADIDADPGDAATFDHLIVDEAHTLEDRTTSALGAEVTLRRWENIVRLFQKGALRVHSPWGAPPALSAVTADYTAAFAAIEERIDNTRGGTRAVELGDERNRFSLVTGAWGAILGDLRQIAEPGDVLREAASNLEALGADLELAITPADPPTHARYADRQGQGRYQRVVLHAAPVNVAEPLARLVWSRYASVVATSATLTAAGSFDYWSKSVGLAAPRTLVCPSPFPYSRLARLYVPNDTDPFLPPTGGATPDDRERYLDRIAAEMLALVDLTRGRALLLFAAYAAMRGVEERIARAAGDYYEILLHGRDGNPAALVERLRHPGKKPVVLCGTRTFWEGVDIPGPALSLVAIDKLPFAPPDDPLEAARAAAIAARGDRPFERRALPAATMLTKQAVGRLIRSTTDRGIIAILDTRLRTKFYGPGIVNSLPRAVYVGKRSLVEEFVDRWEES